ncbi:hypothetical protein BH24GEM2_BH24GEM2_07990 [soil metagenome]
MPNKPEAASELPKVHTTPSGVQYVNAADVLNSTKGQEQIRNLVNSAFYRRMFPQNTGAAGATNNAP